MNLNELTPDTMKSLLNYLVESGMISEELIKKAIKGAVPTEMKRMVDLIHQLLCKADHKREEGLNTCRYLQEEVIEDCWTQSDHQLWLNITTEIMEELGITTEEQLRRTLTQAKIMQGKLRDFQVTEPKAYQLMLKINGWEQT